MQKRADMAKNGSIGRGLVAKSRRLAWSIGGALVALGATTSIVAAASVGQQASEDNSIWPVLLPILAAAASVERAIELGWNYIEWGLLRFAGWRPKDLQSSSYTEFKSGTSLLAGVVLGIIVSNYTGMRLLAYLQPFVGDFLANVPPLWDIVITGLVIGAGSKPAHDILGLITQLKNFTGNSALKQREQAGAALAEGIFKLGQSEKPYRVEVPGIGPTAVGTGSAQAARSRITGETEPSESSAEKYADILHDKLYG